MEGFAAAPETDDYSMIVLKKKNLQNARRKNILELAAVIIFFSAFAFSLSSTVKDPDVFWHLKTGEWIWQHKALPDKDPFALTAEPFQYEASVRISFILKQYWLAQLLLYGFYQIGGFYGIILFRYFIYTSVGLLLYHWMRKEGISRVTTLIFLMPSIWFSTYWIGERPNNLSFLFAVIVVYLLENLRQVKAEVEAKKNLRLNLFLLPLVMLLWANMHGGFMIGNVIIALYMVAEGIRWIIGYGGEGGGGSKKQTARYTPYPTPYALFFIVCISSILISFVNPNTYKAIPVILQLGGTQGRYYLESVSETIGPVKYVVMGHYQHIIVISVIVLPLVIGIRRLKLRAILLVFLLIFLAFNAIRFIPFLVFIATPVIAELWGKSFDRVVKRAEGFHALHAKRYMLLSCIPLLLVFIFVIFLVSYNLEATVFKTQLIHPTYPETCVKFIKAEKPEGQLFNYYDHGGYLIWALWPDYQVFVDGRGLLRTVFVDYKMALSGSLKEVNGVPAWKAILDFYRVNLVVVPSLGGDFRQFARLVHRLVEDKKWSLVFEDKGNLIFVRDTAKNREIIKRYSISKKFAYVVALEQALLYRAKHPQYWRIYLILGEISLYMERPKAALLYFEAAFKLNPSSKTAILDKLIEKAKTGQDYIMLMDEIFK